MEKKELLLVTLEAQGLMKGYKLEVPQEASFGVSVPQGAPYLAEQCAGLYKSAPYHRTTKK